MTKSEKSSCFALAGAAPKLDETHMAAINALFPAYIFRRRKAGEIWTTCCHRHALLEKDHEIMQAIHTPEPKPTAYCCCWPRMRHDEKEPPKPVPCPFCGRVLPVKELGRTGRRDNLAAYRRFVVFQWDGEALWGTAYNAKKVYGDEGGLTRRPLCELHAVYRFTPGRVDKASKHNWMNEWASYTTMDTEGLQPKFKMYEPFNNNAEYGMGYDMIGLSEIGKSHLRYCQAETYHKHGTEFMRFLTLATAYPRQVEMLIKGGMVEAVKDFVVHGVKNAACFDWADPNPATSFGLSKEEWKQFNDCGKDMGVLAAYKRLRRAGGLASLPELQELRNILGMTWFNRVTARMRQNKISMTRMRNYLQKQQAMEQGRKKKPKELKRYAEFWCDYVDAAKYLGYNLKNEVFLFPKNLMASHDKATKAATALKESRRTDDRKAQEKRRLKGLTKKYTFTDGRWIIRPPLYAAEIVAEGKSLKHCVGGYADRHVSGATTILFLRDRKRPGRPLVTIEMKQGRIAQIHGWDDERTACKDNPNRISQREIYKDFLDDWLAWVAAGSKRDKKGHPIMPAKEGAA